MDMGQNNEMPSCQEYVGWADVESVEYKYPPRNAVNKESAILSPIYREHYRFLICTSASWQTPISR